LMAFFYIRMFLVNLMPFDFTSFSGQRGIQGAHTVPLGFRVFARNDTCSSFLRKQESRE